MSITIGHTADCHIGSSNHGPKTSGPGDSVPARTRDTIATVQRVMREAAEREVKAFVFAGDLARTGLPTTTQELGFRQALQPLRNRSIPIFLLPGNHDLNGPGEATALCNFADENVTVLWGDAARRPHLVTDEDGLPLFQLIALPYFSRHHVLAAECGLSREEADHRCAQLAHELILGLLAQCDPGIPVVATCHHNIESAKTGGGFETAGTGDPYIPLAALDRPEIAVSLCGHIHLRQTLGSVSPVHYPGSPDTVDFGEEGQEKSWTLVTIENRQASLEFIPTNPRRFVTLDLAFEEDATPGDLRPLREALALTPVRDAVVRVRYSLRKEQMPSVSQGEMADLLNGAGAWWVAGLHPEVLGPGIIQRIDGITGTDLSPRGAVEAYVRADPSRFPAPQQLLSRLDTLLAKETTNAIAAA